jgi:hypothetical protein
MDNSNMWNSVKFNSNNDVSSSGLCKQLVDASLYMDDGQSKASNKHNRLGGIKWQLRNNNVGCYDSYDYGFIEEIDV